MPQPLKNTYQFRVHTSQRKGEQSQVAYPTFSSSPLITQVIYLTAIYLLLYVPLQVRNSAYTTAETYMIMD